MRYKEEMTAFAGRLGVRTLGKLSLKELAERIDSRPEPTTPRTQLYAFMTWLSDHLLEVNSSDEGSFSREIATWCLFVNKAGYDSGNVVGTFKEWLFEHRQVEPSSTERLNMAEREVKKFYSLPTAAPHRFVSAGEHYQPSPPPEKTFQQFPSVNEASEAQPVDGFGQIHPDRLKLSRYSDSNPEKGEVIDLDDWQRPVVDISSDEDADPKAKNNLSFLTGANRMVFGDDETNLTTDLQEKMKKKKRSKTQTMQSGPTSVQPKRKNKNPCGRCGVPEGSAPASAYVNESLMPRMTDRWSMVDAYRQDGVLQDCHSRPHQDDNVDRPSLDKGFFLTELTDLIASTTVSPLARAPMKNRLPEVFKNDLRQSSGSWVSEPTINTTWVKPEPVPDVVREPSPPVELGVTEKRLDGHRSTQYHPAVLELFKNRKNVWLHKVDKATRAQASSFFWDKDPEEDDMDVSADADADAGLESARDTVMTETEPVAPAVTDADIVALVNSEAEPVAMLTDDAPQRANSTPVIDVVMENHMTMQIPYRDEDEVRTHQLGGDGRVGFKPAVDVVMEDAEPLDDSAAVDVPEAVDVSAIVDEIIAKTASEPVENKSPSVQFMTSSETLNAPETVNHALVENTDIVREVEPEHATTADDNDHDNGTLKEGTRDVGDSVSSDTVIKDVIYVKPDPEPAETEPSQPEEQADITVLDGSKAQ
ncbi:hypothetical protein N0V85_006941 [Neurospora sp. IMI 360204]|nr:hypothetical protein N0V85_006941 [Neurospora sp. IMI 360204]